MSEEQEVKQELLQLIDCMRVDIVESEDKWFKDNNPYEGPTTYFDVLTTLIVILDEMEDSGKFDDDEGTWRDRFKTRKRYYVPE